ncbi:MAG TPA: hypothetical protein VFZ32_12005, partial [Micromonosporaceae bacterium]
MEEREFPSGQSQGGYRKPKFGQSNPSNQNRMSAAGRRENQDKRDSAGSGPPGNGGGCMVLLLFALTGIVGVGGLAIAVFMRI